MDMKVAKITEVGIFTDSLHPDSPFRKPGKLTRIMFEHPIHFDAGKIDGEENEFYKIVVDDGTP